MDLPHRTLSLKGYEVDIIAATGQFYHGSDIAPVDWQFIFQTWERPAGDPWQDDFLDQQALHCTITGDSWSIEPLDWRPRIQRRGKPLLSNGEKQYLRLINQICRNRRFFVTENGRFGLGTFNLQKGDKVSILLGGKTPFVLRLCGLPRGNTIGREHYKVVGETFVDGLMYHQGRMEDDSRSEKVILRWYHLRWGL